MSEIPFLEKVKKEMNNPQIWYWLLLALGIIGLIILLLWYFHIRKKKESLEE
jgi:LPXTG-motif cell wall-anchored protein